MSLSWYFSEKKLHSFKKQFFLFDLISVSLGYENLEALLQTPLAL